MDAKHTPGPWTVTDHRGGSHIRDSDGHQLYWLGASSRFAAGENEANARLIAAAPELLAALKRLTSQMMIAGNDHDLTVRAFQIPTKEVRMARAAIAKAETH